jgi:hypothetical protein
MEAAVTTKVEQEGASGPDAVRESLDDQARRKGAQPLRSADDLRNDEIWESDEELAEFLAHLDAARQV